MIAWPTALSFSAPGWLYPAEAAIVSTAISPRGSPNSWSRDASAWRAMAISFSVASFCSSIGARIFASAPGDLFVQAVLAQVTLTDAMRELLQVRQDLLRSPSTAEIVADDG